MAGCRLCRVSPTIPMPYFIRITNRVFGPYNESQLLDMKTKGKMTRLTEVSENKKDWHPAETLGFLFSVGNDALPPASHESAHWFYSTNGIEGYGPVAASVVRQMIQSGQLQDNSYVWQQGQNARFVKSEPQFAHPFNHSPASQAAAVAGSKVIEEGYILESDKRMDTDAVIRPIAASLGWLMFLKIIFLILIILMGLGILGNCYALISHAVKINSARFLLSTLIGITINASVCGLQFKTFLCFWKYHSDAVSAAASGKVSALVQAQRSLWLLWKWQGITILAFLTVMLMITILFFAPGDLLSDIYPPQSL